MRGTKYYVSTIMVDDMMLVDLLVLLTSRLEVPDAPLGFIPSE